MQYTPGMPLIFSTRICRELKTKSGFDVKKQWLLTMLLVLERLIEPFSFSCLVRFRAASKIKEVNGLMLLVGLPRLRFSRY